MNNKPTLVVFLSLIVMGLCQRAGYAGFRPQGYPVIVTSSTVAPTAASNSMLGDRFGADFIQPTTPPPILPVEANGNTQFVNYLNTLPVDQQPFWFINSQAMDNQRAQPKTWAAKPNGYIDIASRGLDRKIELVPDYKSFV